ncbi:hypothetical protein ASV10_17815 [Enterobacter hormaechei subsp. xiangfangensis]|nr:hypothetical protein ASV10_17815 [Enterobacter hormaechei subsp. xiangfangensis]KTJ18078.1 hypothetical protein ASU90_17835 [Enterobacter hormaechei subsp. xiangfangensis]CZV62556.1 Uncharacterised protein [Enterobacter hormaechei]
MPAIDVVFPHCFSSSQVMGNGTSQSGHQAALALSVQLWLTQKASEPGNIERVMSRIGGRAATALQVSDLTLP